MPVRMRNLAVGTSECVVLETAQDGRNLAGNLYQLGKEKMKFKTGNGPNGTVNVWRIK